MLGLHVNDFGLTWRKNSDVAAAKKASTDAKPQGAPEEEAQPLGGAASRRRLRHVSQIAIRSLDFEATDTGYVLEVAAAAATESGGSSALAIGETLERSDVLHTRNPTWSPACGIRHGRHLSACELRAVDLRDESVCWRECVQLSDLEPICEELEELNPAPAASPLLRLGEKGKWFALRGTAGANNVSVSSSTGTTSAAEQRRRSIVKQIQASQVCDAGKSISDMLSRLKNLQAQSSSLRDAMEKSIGQGREIHVRRQHHASCEQRVNHLRQEVEQRRQRLEQLRGKVIKEKEARLVSQAEQLQQCSQSLSATEEEQRAEALSLPATKAGLRSLWHQLRCRQIRMLHEVCQVYPIKRENDGRYRTIRSLDLASIDTLSRQDLREEEGISTALGYLAHLLVTLASILEVPLRITIKDAGGSRSYLSDPHESLDSNIPPREWPLYYGRGLEKSRFETALRLLRDGLHQFLYSRGYFDKRKADEGGNLLECAELILEKEMRGID
mmetsp:Transcript_34669/g.64213  ORF Transcript_34669/g.64213 Transcript_34669/m.64213 type:complete len:501 (+) Transcript_34669:137-1639(+)